MAQFEIISPNTNPRPDGTRVKLLALHHAAGNISPRNLLGMARFATNQFGNSGASCHYAVRNSEIGQGAPETRRTWTTSNRNIDNQAITFEIANSRNDSADWPMTEETLNTVATMCVEQARFYGYDTIAFYGDPANFGAPNEMVIVFHRWYAATNCPGPFFERNIGAFVIACNHLLAGRNARLVKIDARTVECVVDGPPALEPVAPLPPPTAPVEKNPTLSVGDIVNFTGGPNFVSSTATSPAGTRNAGAARVTAIATRGTQTVHLVGQPGGSNVHGWVPLSSVERSTTTPPVETPPAAPVTPPPAPTPPPAAPPNEEFRVRITTPALNVRSGPSASHRVNRQLVNDPNIYTIVEVVDGWGRLKSGAGWINLQFTSRV